MYKIKREEFTELVYQQIKNLILKNELKTGEKLNQQKLAERLGVSRTPIQAAFSKLEKEWLIELVPRRGAFIKKLTKDEFLNIYDIRLRLEPLGAHQAALYANKNEIQKLANIITQLDTLRKNGNKSEYKETDYYFHMQIMEMSKNKMLYQIISSSNLLLISNLEGILLDFDQSLNDHINILNSIKNKENKLAENLMIDHIQNAKENIMKKIG